MVIRTARREPEEAIPEFSPGHEGFQWVLEITMEWDETIFEMWMSHTIHDRRSVRVCRKQLDELAHSSDPPDWVSAEPLIATLERALVIERRSCMQGDWSDRLGRVTGFSPAATLPPVSSAEVEPAVVLERIQALAVGHRVPPLQVLLGYVGRFILQLSGREDELLVCFAPLRTRATAKMTGPFFMYTAVSLTAQHPVDLGIDVYGQILQLATGQVPVVEPYLFRRLLEERDSTSPPEKGFTSYVANFWDDDDGSLTQEYASFHTKGPVAFEEEPTGSLEYCAFMNSPNGAFCSFLNPHTDLLFRKWITTVDEPRFDAEKGAHRNLSVPRRPWPDRNLGQILAGLNVATRRPTTTEAAFLYAGLKGDASAAECHVHNSSFSRDLVVLDCVLTGHSGRVDDWSADDEAPVDAVRIWERDQHGVLVAVDLQLTRRLAFDAADRASLEIVSAGFRYLQVLDAEFPLGAAFSSVVAFAFDFTATLAQQGFIPLWEQPDLLQELTTQILADGNQTALEIGRRIYDLAAN